MERENERKRKAVAYYYKVVEMEEFFLTIDFRYHFPVFLYRRFNERVEDCAGEIDRPLPRLFFLDKNVFCYREHLQ